MQAADVEFGMPRSVRTTVSLPEDQYRELSRIAKDQHVSTAWVVRDALRSYFAERYPLLEPGVSRKRDAVGIGRILKKKRLSANGKEK